MIRTSGMGVRSTPGSEGLGDTVARLARCVGADKAAAAYSRITGKDCGCDERREALNRLFPYGKS